MENFLSLKRPPEHIRPQLDIGYKIDNQSVYILEIRPNWQNPEIIEERPIAKTTFAKNDLHWKVFWKLSNGTWTSYKPTPIVKNLKEFTKLVAEDKHHCFFG